MVEFDAPDLVSQIERLQPEQIDALPYGSIRLDPALRVTFYSRAEAELSGYAERPAIGRIFFSEIAPCMSSAEFLGRIEAARAKGKLDLEFTWIGDFSDPDRELQVRVLSGTDGGVWLFLKRDP
jgi:photoactive yellow protein